MPRTPYPIEGVVYEIDGTAFQGAIVEVYNLHLDDSIQTVTDSNGQYTLDRANARKEWEDNQPILIRAYVDGRYFRLAEYKCVMTGSSITKDLNLTVAQPSLPFTVKIPQIEKNEHDPINNAKRVIDAQTPQDIRYDASDDAPNYIGLNYFNSNAATDQNTWTVLKFTYSGVNVTRIQQREAVAWDDRATLF